MLSDRRYAALTRRSPGCFSVTGLSTHEAVVNQLRTLGTLDLVDAEGNELRSILAQPKRAALLTWLALSTSRGPQRRDSLLALFWPEQDAEHARAALNQSVHFLRRALSAESIVARNAAELAIDSSLLWCDAIAFEGELDAGHLSEALELYRGDFLEGFHVVGVPEFERWVTSERARLATRYAGAIEAMAAAREAAGDFAGAVGLWRQLAARDLLSSRTTLRLMHALVAAGDPGGAVQHARVHETVLREELNVQPDAQVQALVRELQSQRVVPRPTSSVNAGAIVAHSEQPALAPVPLRANAPSPPWWRRHATLAAVGVACLLLLGPRTGASDNDTRVAELMTRGRNAERSRS